MASAPRPGAARKAEEEQKRARLGWVLKVRGQEIRLNMADLGPADTRLVRGATGYKLLSILGEQDGLDFDYVLVLWWLARRKAGEPDLMFEQAEAEFPSYEEAINQQAVRSWVEELDDEEASDGSPEA